MSTRTHGRATGGRRTSPGRTLPEIVGGAAGVVALLLATPLSVVQVVDGDSGLAVLSAVGLALVAVAGAVAVCRLLWSEHRGWRSALVIAGGLALAYVAWGVGHVALFLTQDTCGDVDDVYIAQSAGLVAYFAVAACGFLRPRWLLLAWPLAVLGGIAVYAAVYADLPGEHIACFS